MLDSYQEIVESFSSQQYFGNAHALESAEEGTDACYYVELKPRYPENKHVQFATLWRLMQHHDPFQEHSHSSPDEKQESLRLQFQHVIDSWNPSSADETHKDRVIVELEKCQDSINMNNKLVDYRNNRKVGYYLNSKYRGNKYPTEIVNRLARQTPKLVISDEWNDFMVVYEEKSVYSLFYWGTGA